MYDLEGFCIKQEEKINYIHKVNDEVIINEYINHKLTFEQTILNDCKLLKNVILNLDKGLYIIYINYIIKIKIFSKCFHKYKLSLIYLFI